MLLDLIDKTVGVMSGNNSPNTNYLHRHSWYGGMTARHPLERIVP